jgi:4a-hydroxytetrahydrobiopterin dehydratase
MATVEAPIAAALSQEEAAARAEFIPEWILKDGAIEREFKFRNFREAMAFINQVAEAAEAVKHHPDIWISYNRVRLELSTHSLGGLSPKDFDLAAAIDGLVPAG